MGWEKRGNRTYYYRKRRIGKRVVSEYVGGGIDGAIIGQLEEARRESRTLERLDELEERARLEQEEAQLDTVADALEALTTGVLLMNGFHSHNGQWRRRRS